MILPASYRSGFAPRDGQPLHPELWRGSVGAWAPCLGPTALLLRDWSKSRNNATLTNMDAGTDWVISGGRYALDLDGTNDSLVSSVGNTADAMNSNLFSINLWCYIRSFSNSPVLWMTSSNGSLDSGLIEFNNTGSILYIKSANQTSSLTGARTYTLSTAVAVNTWTHISWNKTGTGDSGILRVNGVTQTSYTGTLQTTVVVASYSNVVGAYFNSTYCNGLIDDIRIYDRPLSHNESVRLASRRGIAYELAPRRRSSTQVITGNRRRRLLIGAH